VNTKRVWLCWSFAQCAPHIEDEEYGLRINLRAFVENRPGDYVPIAIFANRDEAHAFFEAHRAQFEQRYNAMRKRKGLS
jgi:hypothetical protein